MEKRASAIILTCAIAVAAAQGAVSAEEPRCRRLGATRPGAYCITNLSPNGAGDILYFFHGAGGDERDWGGHFSRHAAAIEREWRDSGGTIGRVVTVSFGPRTMLTPELVEAFARDVIAAVETEPAPPSRRLLLGQSMGGFNAAHVFLRHPELFARVALLCPALFTVEPSAPEAEVAAYLARTGAREELVRSAVAILRENFSEPDSWRRSSPLLLGPSRLSAEVPALYVSCGTSDEYGVLEGARAFAELARSKGVSVSWTPLNGGHCTVDPRSVARFLATR